MDDKNKENKDIKITITLPSTAYFVSGIRDFTLNLVKNTTEFSEQWAFRFQSVIDELCNNAIEYGSSPGSDVRITFNLVHGEFLEIVVEDTGTGREKLKAAQVKKMYEDRRAPGYVFSGIRGRGLAKIVGEWTDELKFEDRPEGGLRVTVKKYMKNPRQNENSLKTGQNSLSSEEIGEHIVIES